MFSCGGCFLPKFEARMLLEHPRSSKYLAVFWPNTSIGSGKNGEPRQKSPTGIVALDPPKKDGGVFYRLTLTAPKARINQLVFSFD